MTERDRERDGERERDKERDRERDAQIDYHKEFRSLGGTLPKENNNYYIYLVSCAVK